MSVVELLASVFGGPESPGSLEKGEDTVRVWVEDADDVPPGHVAHRSSGVHYYDVPLDPEIIVSVEEPASFVEMQPFSSEKAWQPYMGPRGGEGWINTATHQVVYDDDPPGGSGYAPEGVEPSGREIEGSEIHEIIEWREAGADDVDEGYEARWVDPDTGHEWEGVVTSVSGDSVTITTPDERDVEVPDGAGLRTPQTAYYGSGVAESDHSWLPEEPGTATPEQLTAEAIRSAAETESIGDTRPLERFVSVAASRGEDAGAVVEALVEAADKHPGIDASEVPDIIDRAAGADDPDDDLSGKTTEELEDLAEYHWGQYESAREARGGQGGRSVDTQMDELMKDELETLRRIDRELRGRGDGAGEKAGFKYPDAGENAQPEVRSAVERWRDEEMDDPDDTRHDTPLLYWLLGDGTPPYKMDQEDAGYRPEPNGGQKCENCEYMYEEVASGEGICSQIRGEVSRDGWCRLWEAAGDEKENEKAAAPGDEAAEVKAWVPYEGPQGGSGWQDVETDRVVYQEDPPGAVMDPDDVPQEVYDGFAERYDTDPGRIREVFEDAFTEQAVEVSDILGTPEEDAEWERRMEADPDADPVDTALDVRLGVDDELRESYPDVSNEILGVAKELIADGECEDAEGVNDGFCRYVAEEAYERAGFPDDVEILENGNRSNHHFIEYDGKYYDAEAPGGVEDWRDLPFFQRTAAPPWEPDVVTPEETDTGAGRDEFLREVRSGSERDAPNPIQEGLTPTDMEPPGEFPIDEGIDDGSISWVPVENIVSGQEEVDLGAVRHHMESIRNGEITPPVGPGTLEDDNSVSIQDGNHRAVAAWLLGYDRVPVDSLPVQERYDRAGEGETFLFEKGVEDADHRPIEEVLNDPDLPTTNTLALKGERVYVSNVHEAPDGATVHHDEDDGLYYETDASEKAWVRYEGPRGGSGWLNTNSGEVVYREDKPGGGAEDQRGRVMSLSEPRVVAAIDDPDELVSMSEQWDDQILDLSDRIRSLDKDSMGAGEYWEAESEIDEQIDDLKDAREYATDRMADLARESDSVEDVRSVVDYAEGLKEDARGLENRQVELYEEMFEEGVSDEERDRMLEEERRVRDVQDTVESLHYDVKYIKQIAEGEFSGADFDYEDSDEVYREMSELSRERSSLMKRRQQIDAVYREVSPDLEEFKDGDELTEGGIEAYTEARDAIRDAHQERVAPLKEREGELKSGIDERRRKLDSLKEDWFVEELKGGGTLSPEEVGIDADASPLELGELPERRARGFEGGQTPLNAAWNEWFSDPSPDTKTGLVDMLRTEEGQRQTADDLADAGLLDRDTIRVFRGGDVNPDRGFDSWTTSLDEAERFARYDHGSIPVGQNMAHGLAMMASGAADRDLEELAENIHVADVPVENVVGFDRRESEVVVSDRPVDRDRFVSVPDEKAWVPYRGPQGGEGWQDARSGRVVYREDPPGDVISEDDVWEYLEGQDLTPDEILDVVDRLGLAPPDEAGDVSAGIGDRVEVEDNAGRVWEGELVFNDGNWIDVVDDRGVKHELEVEDLRGVVEEGDPEDTTGYDSYNPDRVDETIPDEEYIDYLAGTDSPGSAAHEVRERVESGEPPRLAITRTYGFTSGHRIIKDIERGHRIADNSAPEHLDPTRAEEMVDINDTASTSGISASAMDVAVMPDDGLVYVTYVEKGADPGRGSSVEQTRAAADAIAGERAMKAMGVEVPDHYYEHNRFYAVEGVSGTLAADAADDDDLAVGNPDQAMDALAAGILAGNRDQHGANVMITDDGKLAPFDLDLSALDATGWDTSHSSFRKATRTAWASGAGRDVLYGDEDEFMARDKIAEHLEYRAMQMASELDPDEVTKDIPSDRARETIRNNIEHFARKWEEEWG